LRTGTGDQVVLILVGVLAFRASMNRTGAPAWLLTVGVVAGGIVWQRYRWISGGRRRMADGVAEMASLAEGRPGGSVASVKAKSGLQLGTRWARVGSGERVALTFAAIFAIYVVLSVNGAPWWLQVAAVVAAGLIWPSCRWAYGRRRQRRGIDRAPGDE
jgi:hypothetical protein